MTDKSSKKAPSLKDLIFKPTTERTDHLGFSPDLFEWLTIPSGQVTLIGDSKGYLARNTEITLTVDSFSISKYPITNRQYAPYVADGNPAPPYWNDAQFNHLAQPVVGISWFDAINYSAWLSTKLVYEVAPPLDYQWQRAAQGDTDNKFPWGNRWQPDYANTSERIGRTTPVDRYPQGASPYGVFDFAGNVWEWCYIDSNLVDDDIVASSVLCGGSYLNYEMFATVHSRNIRLPNMHYNDVGLRLVKL
ncbi:MAG: formylglycine-generating enzyme family protein [Chloroflexota bacterium]